MIWNATTGAASTITLDASTTYGITAVILAEITKFKARNRAGIERYWTAESAV